MPLPNRVQFASASGSLWRQTFTITDAAGVVDLTGLGWEFVIRPNTTDITVPALVSVTTTPSAQGQIDVTPLQGIVTVTLTPAATALLGQGSRPHALWSNPGQDDALCWCEGRFNTQLVATA
ncbi:hypothetical protein ABZX65_26685 [Streptomyces sp. NPDC003300]|uniref:hypothetical protein n=1 Tax=unclassified Streptomyces TaxID=2593676 RepID=UPI0033ABFDD2